MSAVVVVHSRSIMHYISSVTNKLWIHGLNNNDSCYKWSCLDFVLNSIEMMHKVYQESTWGAIAIETNWVVWNLSLECNFVQAASGNLLTWLIIIFLKLFKIVLLTLQTIGFFFYSWLFYYTSSDQIMKEFASNENQSLRIVNFLPF